MKVDLYRGAEVQAAVDALPLHLKGVAVCWANSLYSNAYYNTGRYGLALFPSAKDHIDRMVNTLQSAVS